MDLWEMFKDSSKWIFSGIGAIFLGWLIRMIFKKRSSKGPLAGSLSVGGSVSQSGQGVQIFQSSGSVVVSVPANGTAPSNSSFSSYDELRRFARVLLDENLAVLQACGPDSFQARTSPTSNGAGLWQKRKLELLIPNNRRVVDAFESNRNLVPEEHWRLFLEFREHAAAFAHNAETPLDGSFNPRFPQAFRAILEGR